MSHPNRDPSSVHSSLSSPHHAIHMHSAIPKIITRKSRKLKVRSTRPISSNAQSDNLHAFIYSNTRSVSNISVPHSSPSPLFLWFANKKNDYRELAPLLYPCSWPQAKKLKVWLKEMNEPRNGAKTLWLNYRWDFVTLGWGEVQEG